MAEMKPDQILYNCAFLRSSFKSKRPAIIVLLYDSATD